MKDSTVKLILEELYSKIRADLKPGLERTLELLDFVGNPHKLIKTIHIAGTNGKGAVVSMLGSIAHETGLKTGIYTSPHLFNFNERIVVNNQFITNLEIVNFYRNIKEKVKEIEATFFEITTVLAFYHFAKKKVDIAIIETGLGGRLDSTNVLEPKATAITSIGYDHMDILGNSIEQIAEEKAGIVKPNAPMYLLADIDRDVLEVIQETVTEKNTSLIIIPTTENIRYRKDMTTLLFSDKHEFKIPLPGKNQAGNFLLARAIAKDILRSSDKQIQAGISKLFSNTAYFGRASIIKTNPTILIDVSHNEEAIKNLIQSILKHIQQERFVIMLTLMNDKNYENILDLLHPISKLFVITKSSSKRNIDISKLSQYCCEKSYAYIIKDNPEEGFDYLIELKQDAIITGSFYLVSDLKNKLKKYDVCNNLL